MKRHTTLILTFVIVTLAFAPQKSDAQVAVYDLPLTIQSFILQYGTLGEEIYHTYQQVESLYNQYQQIQNELRMLKTWSLGGNWHNLIGVYGNIENLLDRVDHLGYQTGGLEVLLNQTFPGLQLPVDWNTEHRQRINRSLLTTKDLLNVLDHVSRMNMQSQIRLAQAQDKLNNSDGVVQNLQAQTLMTSLSVEESGRLLQATLTDANLNGLIHAYHLQQEATAIEIRDHMLTKDALPPVGADTSSGYGAIPADWRW